MQIFVRTGLSETPLSLSLSNLSSVSDLKKEIEDQTFLPVEQLRLVRSSTSTEVTSLFELAEDEEIVLEVPFDAGMRAKWRKKRMRRLRRKRRKMRMRAR